MTKSNITTKPHTLLGIEGKLVRNTVPLRRNNYWYFEEQKFIAEHVSEGVKAVMTVSFDDRHSNGRHMFRVSVEKGTEKQWKQGMQSFHGLNDCWKTLPEPFRPIRSLRHYLGMTDFGPRDYSKAASYAGNTDHLGHKPGDPDRLLKAAYFFSTKGRFNRFPIPYIFKGEAFWEFVKGERHEGRELILREVAGPDGRLAYTCEGFNFPGSQPAEAHSCEWSEINYAEGVITALNHLEPVFVEIPASYSKGKPREFDKARNAAAWPEATDEQLSQPRVEVEHMLDQRLPGLIEGFRLVINELGFLWPQYEDVWGKKINVMMQYPLGEKYTEKANQFMRHFPGASLLLESETRRVILIAHKDDMGF